MPIHMQALQSPVIGRFDQLMHQSGGRREADLETLLASRETKAQSDVILPVPLGPRAMTFSRLRP